VVAEKDAFITALKGLVEKLEGQVGRYRHAKFGPKSEKLDPAQLEPALEGAPSRRHWFKPNGERKPRSPKRRRKLLLSRKRLRPARLTRTRQRPRVPRKARALWLLSVRRRENDPPDHFLTFLHFEFVCSFNGYASLAQ